MKKYLDRHHQSHSLRSMSASATSVTSRSSNRGGMTGKDDLTERDDGSDRPDASVTDRTTGGVDNENPFRASSLAFSSSSSDHAVDSLLMPPPSPAQRDRFHLLKSLKSERHIIEPAFLSHSKRANDFTQSMSLQKLQWHRLGLYGRDHEMEQLTQALTQVTGDQKSRTLVLLDGPSGVGKTALAAQLQEPVQRAGGIYVLGKFDLQQMGEPYSGIQIAMTQLCHSILQLKQFSSENQMVQTVQRQKFATIQAKLMEQLSPETIDLLSNLVPSLKLVMGQHQQPQQSSQEDRYKSHLSTASLDMSNSLHGSNHHSRFLSNTNSRHRLTKMKNKNSSPSHDNNTQQRKQQPQQKRRSTILGGKESVDQLNFAFRSFVQVLSHIMPLVIVLDDVQWSDKLSLDLVKSWITDVENQSLMIVGCYRSNEEHQSVDEMLYDVQLVQQERSIELLQLHLGDLSPECVTALMADALTMEPHRIQSLANVVYQKTRGNVFYLIQFMESLATSRLLSYNFGLGYWTWDEQQVKLRSEMTTNVVQLLQQKISTGVATKMLPKAACLGARFSFDAIYCIVTMMDNNENVIDPQQRGPAYVRQMLQECIDEGFLDACPGDVFAFAHDKVQEAALALIDEKDLPETQFQIGDLLMTQLGDEEALGSLIFPVANLMSTKARQLDTHHPKRKEIARVHVRAGTMAVHYSAFEAATKYFRTAQELLPKEEHWTTDFDLSLTLCTSAAEAEYCIGNYTDMKDYCQQVLNEPTAPVSVRTRIYSILMDAALANNNHQEAFEYGFAGLKNTGVKVPKKTPAILFCMGTGIMKARRNPCRTIQAMQKLPESEDPLQLATFKTIEKIGTVGYLTGRPELFVACAFTIFHQSLQRGINGYSATAVAQIGFVLTCIVGDVVNGTKYANEALEMLGRVESRAVEAKTKFFVGMMVMHWTKPYASSITILMDGYRCGMKGGDPEYAFYCAFYVMFLSFLTGRPLVGIEKESSIYIKQMEDYLQMVTVWYLLPVLQGVMNLRDPSSISTTELTGQAMKEADLLSSCETAKPTVYSAITIRILLAAYFGEYQVGVDLAEEYGAPLIEQQVGLPHSEVLQYSIGLCYFAMARSTKNKKYARHARECRKKLKKWLKNGNPNCSGYLGLLNAEEAALSGKNKSSVVVDLYQNAIVLNGRFGNVQDQALASERLGEFYLEGGNHSEAKEMFQAAQELYLEWGANAKVEKLTSRISHLPSIKFL
ncbi:Transcriptional regulator [Seminavis robusta]|uniref:Transcriptional regulator n=1 Tax=Seminavis robusta TaxID=568900 RepID=A0A9N8F0Q2_9STRA|nr:Transcriptional regulator [Seminavis robusta]|eukprot:Sro2644_g333540.1 Transcriptional regulator (1232) ;mRNA; r:6011-9928